MSLTVRNSYLQEIDNCLSHLSYDPHNVDVVQRHKAMSRLIVVFTRLISLPPPLKDDMIQLIEDIKEKIEAIFKKELENHHYYCSKLQDLRQELHVMGKPNWARFQQLEWRRCQEIRQEAERRANC